MSRLLHRHRKFLASSALGFWVFALFVGIAHACSRDGATTVAHQPATAVHPHQPATAVPAVGHAMDDSMAPSGELFCNDDLALLGVLQLVQEQPASQPLVLAAHHDLGFLPISAPILRLARTAPRSLGVPFSLRIVRLAL